MRNWTPVAVTVMVALFLVGVALTQPPPGRGRPDGPPPPPPPGGLERALDELKLSDKQKEQADKIVQAHHEKMRKLRDQARDDLLKDLKDVLDKQQLDQVKEVLDRRPPPPPGRGGPIRGIPVNDLVDRIMSFDKNKDGKVTKDELPERLHYLIERGDTNKDGALDLDEVKALAARLNRDGAPPERGADGPPPPPPPPGPPGPPPGPERALDDLKLSDKQKQQADKILREHQEKMRKLRDEMLKEMKEVLNKEQFERFREAMERRPPPPPGPGGPPPDRRPDGPPPPPPPPGPGFLGGPALERALDEMKLSDKQKEQAHKTLRAHQDKVRRLLDQARDDLLKDMKEVLDKEQLEQFKKAIERRPPPPGPGDRPPRPPERE
jgi:Spy/CpxP family protein refolding chaperone